MTSNGHGTQTNAGFRSTFNGASSTTPGGPTWMQFKEIGTIPIPPPPELIAGLLRAGEKLGVTAASKKGKSWFVGEMAYCVANGLDFLGWPTQQSKVAFLDLEFQEHSIDRRMREIQKCYGTGDFRNFRYMPLRGYARQLMEPTVKGQQSNLDALIDLLNFEQFKFIVIDPIYKLMTGQSETKTEFLSFLLERLTELCKQTGACLGYSHHHSKGDQTYKDAGDRGSGSGYFLRDVDTQIDLTEHKESTVDDRIFTVSFILRDQRDINPFVIHSKTPGFSRDKSGLDPEDLKQHCKGKSRSKSSTPERILTALFIAERECSTEGLTIAQLARGIGQTERNIQRVVNKLAGSKIVKCVSIGGWQLIPNFSF